MIYTVVWIYSSCLLYNFTSSSALNGETCRAGHVLKLTCPSLYYRISGIWQWLLWKEEHLSCFSWWSPVWSWTEFLSRIHGTRSSWESTTTSPGPMWDKVTVGSWCNAGRWQGLAKTPTALSMSLGTSWRTSAAGLEPIITGPYGLARNNWPSPPASCRQPSVANASTGPTLDKGISLLAVIQQAGQSTLKRATSCSEDSCAASPSTIIQNGKTLSW